MKKKKDLVKPQQAKSRSSSGTSVHFDADSSSSCLNDNTTFNEQPALQYGDDMVKQAPSNFTALDNRLSSGHVIGIDNYRQIHMKKRITQPEIEIPKRYFPFPAYVDLYFCKPTDTAHLENSLNLPRLARRPENKCLRWAWLCWWRNRAFGCLKSNQSIRDSANKLVSSFMFKILIMIVIIADCVHMASSPTTVENVPILGAMFVTVYMTEMILKMLAFGVFCHRGSYFTSPWNWLDFILTAAGVFSYSTQGIVNLNLTAFRALRTIRILRTISSFKNVRVLVNALFGSMTELLEVILLSMFWMVVFALLGLQFFNGNMKRRCVLPYTFPNDTGFSPALHDHPPGVTLPMLDSQKSLYAVTTRDTVSTTLTYMLSTESTKEVEHSQVTSGIKTTKMRLSPYPEYTSWVYNEVNWEIPQTDDSPVLCGNVTGSRLCPPPYVCMELSAIDNPYDNSLSFDSFGDALLATMQLVILDNWEDVYKKIVHSTGPLSTLFFIGTTFFGSFQLLNVILAVIDTSYHSELEQADVETAEEASVNKSKNNSTTEDNINNSAKPETSSAAPLRSSISKPSAMRGSMSAGKTQRSVSMAEGFTRSPGDAIKDHIEGFKEEEEVNLTPDPTVPVLKTAEDDTTTGMDTDKSAEAPTILSHRKSILKKSAQLGEKIDPSAKRVTIILDPSSVIYLDEIKLSPFWKSVNTYRSYVSEAVEHPVFQLFITMAILANVVVMATEHADMSEIQEIILYKANAGFTFAFLVEVLIKLTAYSPKDFVSNGWNLFDSVIVVVSLADLFISELLPGLTILRAFRLLRVVRLAKVWQTLRILIQTMLHSLPAVLNMTIVAFVMLFTLALFGMHVLNVFYRKKGEIFRWRFTDFSHSMMYAFIIMCGSYIEPLRECVKQAGNEYYVCIISLTPLFVIGNLIILNLYISILLNSFDHETFNVTGGPTAKFKRLGYKLMKTVKRRLTKSHSMVVEYRRKSIMPQVVTPIVKEPIDMSSIVFEKCVNYKPRSSFHEDNVPVPPVVPLNPGSYQSMLYLEQFSPNNKFSFKRLMQKIVSSRAFEFVILIFILASATCLALDDVYLPQRPLLARVLFITNIVITIVFILEMFMRMAAYSCRDYFSIAWNIIDFVIVVFSIFDHLEHLFNWQIGLSAFRALRCFRALRPLRFVSRWPGMKIAVAAMGMAIPSVLNVIVMCMIILATFAILAVNLFSGRMNNCHNATTWQVVYAVNKSSCILEHGESAWRPTRYNFNNIGASYLSLFAIATLDSWTDIYEQASDVVSIDKPLKFEANYLQANIFFLLFTITGAFFTLNLFIGVIIENFNNLKQQMEGKSLRTIMMSDRQRQFFRSMQRLTRVTRSKYYQHRGLPTCRSRLYDIVNSQPFDYFIMVCVIANVVFMCTFRYGQSAQAFYVQNLADSIFTGLFTLELIVKLFAMGRDYFKSGWNIMDSVVVLLGLIGTVLESLGAVIPSSATVIRIVRMFKIFKTFKLARNMRGLQAVLQTMILSLPALFNVFLLLSLAMFIYGLMGIQLFSHIRPTGTLDEVLNFRTLSGALMVLFSMMTGTGWTQVFLALSIEPPLCTKAEDSSGFGRNRLGDCGAYVTALVYSVSYIVLMSFILINTYIAIVLENFLELRQQKLISDADLDTFYYVWAEYDPNETQFIHMSQLSDFLHRLTGTLRVAKPNKIRIAIMDVDMTEGGRIHFTDLMQSVIKYKMGSSEVTRLPGFVLEMIEAHYSIHFPEIQSLKVTSSSRQHLIKEWAANKIAIFWRAYKLRREFSRLDRVLNSFLSNNQNVKTPDVVSKP